jgi:hypothetical protein
VVSKSGKMPTYIVPISGVDFVRYIAFYSIFSGTPLRPKLIISASGGCMISYLAMMSDFEQRVEQWPVNSSLFTYKALPVMPRMVTFLLTGSLYRRPNIDTYINEHFVPSKLTNVEIITGYFSKTKGKIVLSSNLSSTSNTLLKAEHFDLTSTDVEHCDGQLPSILKSIEATTNIPYLLPPLGRSKDIDYGVHSPSPVTFAKLGTPTLDQVVYFSPIDIERTTSSDFLELTFLNSIHTEILRLSAPYHRFTDYKDLTFLDQLATLDKFLLIAYTPVEVDLSVVSFTSADVKDLVKRIKNNTKFRLYY